jgi:hypothetical protein
MKRALLVFLCTVAVGTALAFGAAGSVSAAPAPGSVIQSTGCFVSADGIDYAWDPACAVHVVRDLDADGNLAFHEYQDHGQLPADVAPPSRTVRIVTSNYCLNFGSLGIHCGTAVEIVTPSGEYKSWVKIR